MANVKVKIPFPGRDGLPEYPIVYNWEAGTGGNPDYKYAAGFWERRRQFALSKMTGIAQSSEENMQSLSELGGRLETMGNIERSKEVALLKRALPDFNFDEIDDINLIKKLNEVIRGKEQFKYALDRIHYAMAFGNTKAKTTGQDFKGMAPSIASTFLSYLGTEMSNLFRRFYEHIDPSEPASKWAEYLELHFDEAIDKAMENMLINSQVGREVDNIYGDASQWKAIGEAYKASKEFQEQFRNMIRTKLGVEELKKVFDDGNHSDILARAGQKGKRSGFRTMLDKEFKWKTRQYSIGGSVAEYVETLVGRIAPKGGTIGDRETKVLTGEVLRTDSVDIFRFDIDGTFSADQLANMLNEELLDSSSLKNVAEKMEKFYNNNLKNLDETFIIYTSTKNYSLGAGFSGFHNGSPLPLKNFPDYAEAAEIDKDIAMNFVYTAYNAMKTAIFEENADEIKEDIEHILMSAAARLMFDDWQTIGMENTGAQSLHVFDLDGVIIPSSLLFRRLGNSMKAAAADMRSWVSVRVKLPTTVVYHPGDWQEFGNSNEDIKLGIYDKWNEQFETAEREAKFTVKFLYNFKQLMNHLIEASI